MLSFMFPSYLSQVRTEESSKEAQEAEEARARAKLMKTKQVDHKSTRISSNAL